MLLLSRFPSLLVDIALRDYYESRALAGFGVHLGQILGASCAVYCIRPHDQGCEIGAVCGTVCTLLGCNSRELGAGGRRMPSSKPASMGKSDQFFPKKIREVTSRLILRNGVEWGLKGGVFEKNASCEWVENSVRIPFLRTYPGGQ